MKQTWSISWCCHGSNCPMFACLQGYGGGGSGWPVCDDGGRAGGGLPSSLLPLGRKDAQRTIFISKI